MQEGKHFGTFNKVISMDIGKCKITTTSRNVTTSSSTIITKRSMELVLSMVVMFAITPNFRTRFGDYIASHSSRVLFSHWLGV